MPTRKQLELLEDLVDKHSMSGLLSDLAEIAQLKADHIRENWQDTVTARTWEKAAQKIDALSLKIDV